LEHIPADNERLYSNCLNEIGVTCRSLGEIERAEEAHSLALAWFVSAGDVLGQGRSLTYLAADYLENGDVRRAKACATAATSLLAEGQDMHGQGAALYLLGQAERESGNIAEAVQAQESSIQILGQLGDRHGVANAKRELGLTYAQEGQYDVALENEREALRIFSSYGNAWSQAQIRNNIGDIHKLAERPREAREAYAAVLEMDPSTIGESSRQHAEMGILRLAKPRKTTKDRFKVRLRKFFDRK
jgi:tetratricopeptide (TPR) repeat protein